MTKYFRKMNDTGIQHLISTLVDNNGINTIMSYNVKRSQSIENIFVVLLHIILKTQIKGYRNISVGIYINEAREKLKIKPSELYVSKEVIENSVFGKESTKRIIEDKDFQIGVELLKRKLHTLNGWKPNLESRDDNIMIWINSIFETNLSRCLMQLTKSKNIPDAILYNLLIRKPTNELESKYFFEFYKLYSSELNLLDQEKLFHLKKGDTKLDRNLIIPPLFNNLFQIALRQEVNTLPLLIDLFLNENNISSSNTLEQLSEMIWYLSFDHTGEHMSKPSRFYGIAQSQLIKAVNKMTEQNKDLEIDVTIMLGVSNLTFYKDYKKSFKMFKNAKRQFDHWQLEKFKPSDFKKIGGSKSQSKPLNEENSELLRNIKVDYNIKFLCNSVILLAVNAENKEMISQDLYNIFYKIEPDILAKYPEIWEFVVIKLNYHNLNHEHLINNLFTEYLKLHRTYGLHNYLVLDFIINNTTKSKTLDSLISNLELHDFDDNNLSHLISKYYKLASNNNDSECLEAARSLYKKAPFKSSRINSSYLLGESIFSPHDTYERYNSISDHFKITQLSIASLFVSVFKLVENDQYEHTLWEGQSPFDFAMKEFNKHICKAYGDTSDGLLYPNDNLLIIYIKILKVFQKTDELYTLIDTLVDLKYPLGVTLFKQYLDAVSDYLNAKVSLN
ncbi:hypothetical protein CANINC_004227 [Pichia inconspicua]|uniref:Uncharacterized protein n=1 Tax=Pichia inconspicua TaxID=52247 RepID=A0A4T0WWL1_9ASCO|nr:hypothetical protein CANINC_004227 [[Candida] inconspicua]